MATKLHGLLNLSKIDKSLIVTNQKGEKVLWVDIVPNKGGEDQYGNTHSLQIYNKDTRETIYLGNFKPQEFGSSSRMAVASESADVTDAAQDDLPF